LNFELNRESPAAQRFYFPIQNKKEQVMSELISLFRKVSSESAVREQSAAAERQQPEYFVQLLNYLREIRREQGKALRAAITALAEAD
jgi:hypothetical protein